MTADSLIWSQRRVYPQRRGVSVTPTPGRHCEEVKRLKSSMTESKISLAAEGAAGPKKDWVGRAAGFLGCIKLL